MTATQPSLPHAPASRRSVLASTAWTLPGLGMAVAAPAVAASLPIPSDSLPDSKVIPETDVPLDGLLFHNVSICDPGPNRLDGNLQAANTNAHTAIAQVNLALRDSTGTVAATRSFGPYELEQHRNTGTVNFQFSELTPGTTYTLSAVLSAPNSRTFEVLRTITHRRTN